MANAQSELVGNSFKLGYRYQRYWDTSMALAFFSAEVGAGLFLVSCWCGLRSGMLLGLLLVGILKPYFHIAHMGVPGKSWRAILRPDRSWISRGAIGIGMLVGFGALYLLDLQTGLFAYLGLPRAAGTVVATLASAAALLVMCYQGMAMAASESFALWANPMVPAASMLYAATAGVLLCAVLGLGLGQLAATRVATLTGAAIALLLGDCVALGGILLLAQRKSSGGAFSVSLLLRGEYAAKFVSLVVLVGLVLPLLLVLFTPTMLTLAPATLAMLGGFLAFRLLIFKAAVFEPISHQLAGSLGLMLGR